MRATMTSWEGFNEGKNVSRLRAPRHHVLLLQKQRRGIDK
jgi:hypothetical protein